VFAFEPAEHPEGGFVAPPLPLPELEPLEDPDDEPLEDPDDEPLEDPDDEPLEDPDDEPLEDPDDEPLEDPDDEPLEDPDDEPLEEPDDEPLEEPLPPPLPVPLLLPLPLALPSSNGLLPTIPPSEPMPTPTSSNPTSLPAAQAARTLAAAMPTRPTGRSQDTFMSHLHRCTRRGRRPDFLARAYSPLNGMRHTQTPAALSIETRACENQCHRKRTLSLVRPEQSLWSALVPPESSVRCALKCAIAKGPISRRAQHDLAKRCGGGSERKRGGGAQLPTTPRLNPGSAIRLPNRAPQFSGTGRGRRRPRGVPLRCPPTPRATRLFARRSRSTGAAARSKRARSYSGSRRRRA
jgi:hypothetical protein